METCNACSYPNKDGNVHFWIFTASTFYKCCKHCQPHLPRQNSIRFPFAGPAPAVEEIENGEIENVESELGMDSGLLAETATWY